MDATDLNLRHLGAFAAIARLGGVGAAAAAANLTQPAVTQGLAKLERQLDTALFDRAPRGMAATPAAAILAPRVEAALALIASPRVTMAQLRALVAVAGGGSYVDAGAVTGLAAPSLHRAVRDLSLALGRPLVARRGRGLVLTDAGRRTARAFRLALAELSAGLAEIAALAGRPGARIAIGAMPLARARLLPAVVVAFHRAYPATEIVIAEGSHAELIEPLRDGDLDLLIGALRDPAPGPDVVQTPLFADRPMVIARAGHPLAGTEPDLDALAGFGWIMPAAGTPLRTMWAHDVRRRRVAATAGADRMRLGHRDPRPVARQRFPDIAVARPGRGRTRRGLADVDHRAGPRHGANNRAHHAARLAADGQSKRFPRPCPNNSR